MPLNIVTPYFITTVAITPASRNFTVPAASIGGETKYLILAGVVEYADGTKVSFEARDMIHKWLRGPAAFSRAAAVAPFLDFGWATSVDDVYALSANTSYALSNLVTEKENVAATAVYLSVLVLS